jgi:hypothetical protein
MSFIPLKNKKGEIICNAIVSPEDYEILNQFKWCKDKENYVKMTLKGKNWKLHRYIMIEILKNDITSKNPVDHINNNPLDNRRENLRIVTHSENARNKKKKENCSSKYIGVSKNKSKKTDWKVSIRHNCKKITAYYDNEIHAAYQYNLWIDQFKIKNANKNDIKIPENFVKWKPTKEKIDNLPNGIEKYKDTDKFRVRIRIDNKEKHIGIFNTQEEALEARKQAEKEREIYFKNKLLSISKEFNKDNQCIFKVKEEEIIIDEESFYEIMKYKWHKRKNYFRGEVDGKRVGLTNFIMNYYEDDIIDHINNNPLDNRKENLRIVTAHQNSMNCKSRKGSSKYIGVSKRKNKYVAQIRPNGKQIYLGQFDDEIEAAKVRDNATKKYFGEHGKLNFPVSS